MNSEDQVKFECVRCGNCCKDPNTIVNLCYTDILRIKKNLNLDLDELLEIVGFYIFTDQLEGDTKKRLVISPLETERGLSFIGLLKSKTGTCIFYDGEKKKCKIYSIRPNFCRSFPFTFHSERNSEKLSILITEKGKEYCLGLTPDAPHINKSQWLELGKNITKDLQQNLKVINRWNSLVRKERIKPSAKEFLRKVLELKDRKKN